MARSLDPVSPILLSMEAELLAMQGDVDGAMHILQSLADQGHFSEEYGSPYVDWLGLQDSLITLHCLTGSMPGRLASVGCTSH